MQQTAKDFELYEMKILQDSEFPIQLSMNRTQLRGWYFQPHWHEYIELHYVVSGKTQIQLEQELFTAREGDLVVANSNVLHAGYCDGTPLEVLVVIFALEDFSKELADKSVVFCPLVEKDARIGRLMLGVYQENKTRGVAWRMACRGLLLELVTELVRYHVLEMLSDSDSLRRQKKLERIHTVISYIESHSNEEISNRQLADLIHLSEGRFNHLFKEGVGMPPLQYINRIRLNKAMGLLRRGEFTASEVAALVGFDDYNHFGRLFRRYFGRTPAQVQKRQA